VVLVAALACALAGACTGSAAGRSTPASAAAKPKARPVSRADGAADFGNAADASGTIGSGSSTQDSSVAADATVVCGKVTASAELEPVYLAFDFDVSGSMGKGDKKWHDKSLKWDPVVAATRAFFDAPTSAGLTASLVFFPVEGGDSARCAQMPYETPDVPMTPLPSGAFGAAIDAIEPQSSSDWRGGTPTAWVVRGTLAFLKSYRSDHPGRFAIVLVTDGYPEGCSADDDMIATVAADVHAALADGISTYVIGVANPPISGAPDTVSNLQQIAVAGGTDHAFIIDTGDPAGTTSAFGAAVDSIRSASIACELDLPKPPDGRSFDKEKVSVLYASGANPAMDLPYEGACASAGGWHYDDPSQPSKIVLCEDACSTVKADSHASLSVAFVCERVIRVE
jgi:hypothetical protein